MKFSLYITSQTNAPMYAYHFAQESLEQNHEITCVFLHDEGVFLLKQNVSLAKKWSALATNNSFKLILCSQSAQNRLISNEDLIQGFEIDSLMNLLEAERDCDRIIQFRD